ncbi:MAG: flagellar protein FliT [Lachnospiraceae bacterium]|nr:flagellar protein FliT [Lachnospiraceae bacterium]
MENYLEILTDSLKKKSKVLDEIMRYNSDQENLLRQESISLEELDANMELKDGLIQKLVQLDDGFETLYERIKEKLLTQKDQYKAQIGQMQELISEITEKSVSIQAQEARNKGMIENYFARERGQLRQSRQVSKAAYGYYKSMSNGVSSQLLDQKK